MAQACREGVWQRPRGCLVSQKVTNGMDGAVADGGAEDDDDDDDGGGGGGGGGDAPTPPL